MFADYHRLWLDHILQEHGSDEGANEDKDFITDTASKLYYLSLLHLKGILLHTRERLHHSRSSTNFLKNMCWKMKFECIVIETV